MYTTTTTCHSANDTTYPAIKNDSIGDQFHGLNKVKQSTRLV